MLEIQLFINFGLNIFHITIADEHAILSLHVIHTFSGRY